MKLGLIISLILVLFLSLLGFFAYRGVSDQPTGATSDEKLIKKQLPTDLAPLFIPTVPNGDAARTYAKVFNLYHDHKDVFTNTLPSEGLVDQLINLLMEAMQQERISDGFLDDHIPVQPSATPDFHDAMESLPAFALGQADEAYQEGRQSYAITVARAVWAWGQRAFQHNTRLYNRFQGLTIMLDAGDKLLPWAVEVGSRDSETIRQWMEAVHGIEKTWRSKHKLLASLKPKVGDLVHIARDDQDISFQIEAVLKLGLAKFNPGGRGNNRSIQLTIEQAKNHTHPMMVQAGIAAAGLTKEQMHKLY